MHEESTSVLIVGGGPVGLSAALFLARQGVRPILVERRAGLSSVPRATGLHCRTMEILRTVGLAAAVSDLGMEMVAPGTNIEKIRAGKATPILVLGTRTLADIGDAIVIESHDEDYDFTPSPPIWCGQNHYEPLLAGDARSYGADLRFGVEMVSFQQDEAGVSAVVQNRRTHQRSTIRADYLVAADGANGSTRKALRIGHRSHGSCGHFVSIIFRARIDLPPEAPMFTFVLLFHPEAHGVLFVVEPDRWMFGVNYYPERGQSPAEFTPERCVELVRIATGIPDLDIEVESSSPWEARHLVADRYRAGRVFLAGDACHTHPPSGGFGVNAGMQDAHNLAWKLAAVLRGWAHESLLETYEAERRPVGAATADQAWLLFNSRGGAMTDEEKADLRDVQVVSSGYQYFSKAVVHEGVARQVVPRKLAFTGRPGSRLPHLWLARDGSRISTIDLLSEDGFVLLTGTAGASWRIAAERVAQELAVPLRCYVIGPHGDVVDLDAQWPAACGVSADGALLVRPDGFVAWRAAGASPEPDRVLVDALAQIIGRTVALPA